MQSLAVEQKYVAVREKMHFVQLFAHIRTINRQIDSVNLNQIYVPTKLLTMRVGTIRLQEYHGAMENDERISGCNQDDDLLELMNLLSDEEDDGMEMMLRKM